MSSFIALLYYCHFTAWKSQWYPDTNKTNAMFTLATQSFTEFGDQRAHFQKLFGALCNESSNKYQKQRQNGQQVSGKCCKGEVQRKWQPVRREILPHHFSTAWTGCRGELNEAWEHRAMAKPQTKMRLCWLGSCVLSRWPVCEADCGEEGIVS